MNQVKKLDFLDGIKVLACIAIFNFHFINFFYPGIYCLQEEYYHLPKLEYIIGSTPLNLILDSGKFSVRMFMTLSGFFVGYRFFLTGDKKSLKTGAVKKYFRLVLPILVTNLVIFVLMFFGLFRNHEASVLANSEVFVGNYFGFEPSIFGAIKEAVWGCFVTGANQYNGPLWFIYYEFLGTLLMAAILSLVGESKARYVVYIIASLILIRTDFLPFILGTVVCDLTYRQPEWLKKLTTQKWLMALMLLFGLFLGSFPPIGEHMEGTIYQFFPLKIMLYYNVGASIVIFALLHLEKISKHIAIKPFLWFNQYTYGFYLLHFTVLCTFSSWFYLALESKMNYHLLALINYVLSFLLVTLLSMLMKRFVEEPGIKLSQKIGGYFDKN